MALLCGARSPRCSTAVLVCKGKRSALERRQSPAIVRLLCAVAHNDPDVGQDEVHPRRVKTHDLESTTASYRSCFCRGREDKQQSPASTRTADGEWTCAVKQRGPITLPFLLRHASAVHTEPGTLSSGNVSCRSLVRFGKATEKNGAVARRSTTETASNRQCRCDHD